MHFLAVDDAGGVLARLRSADDARYPGRGTSTVGTHVPHGAADADALRDALPVPLAVAWVGEFRLKDAHENEVCGLFVARVGASPPPLSGTHRLLAPAEVEAATRDGRATPHLAAAWRRLHGR